ncbi:MAG: type III secretion system chaperone [Acetobacteraceae bacterium]
MTELGPAWEAIDAIVPAQTSAWAVLLSDGRTVGIEHEPEAGRVVISARLGRVPEQHRLSIYAAMLNYNALGHEVGGAWMSLAGAALEAELTAVLAEESLTLSGLRAVVAFLADSARAWVAMMHDPGDADLMAPRGSLRA